MSEEASDVTRALAAFGAPSIRYHSFGQAQIRPSNVVLPHRTPPAELLQDSVPDDTMPLVAVKQSEPVASPEPMPGFIPAPRPVSALSSPVPPLRAPIPVRGAPLFPAIPTMAPPPRPLAEWAAPVAPAAPVLAVPVPVPTIPPAPAPVAMAPAETAPTAPMPMAPTPVMPLSTGQTLGGAPMTRHTAQAESVIPTPAHHQTPAATGLSQAAPSPHAPPPSRPVPSLVVSAPQLDHAQPTTAAAGRTLPELFEFLAATPAIGVNQR